MKKNFTCAHIIIIYCTIFPFLAHCGLQYKTQRWGDRIVIADHFPITHDNDVNMAPFFEDLAIMIVAHILVSDRKIYDHFTIKCL